MSNLKLNKKVKEEDFDVIPDLPKVNETVNIDSEGKEDTSNFINMEEEGEQGRKLFANKKANIAFGIAGGIILVIILAALIFVYLV